jgi:adenylate cyclase
VPAALPSGSGDRHPDGGRPGADLGARQFDETLPYLRASITASEHVDQCGPLGLIEEAQEYIAARNKLGPLVRLSVLRRNLANFAPCDAFIEGLKKAGVPE